MFGLLPLLRGALILAVMAGGVGAVLLALGWGLKAALRAGGVDLGELAAYRARQRIYLEQLRQLEAQAAEHEPASPGFEPAMLTLAAFRASAPEPPRWAVWLHRRTE